MVEGLACFRIDISQKDIQIDIKRGGFLTPLFVLFDLDVFSLKLLILILGKRFEAN